MKPSLPIRLPSHSTEVIRAPLASNLKVNPEEVDNCSATIPPPLFESLLEEIGFIEEVV